MSKINIKIHEIMRNGAPGITIATFIFLVVSADIGVGIIIVNKGWLLITAFLFTTSSVLLMFNYLFSSKYIIQYDTPGEKIASVFFHFAVMMLFLFGLFWVLAEFEVIS